MKHKNLVISAVIVLFILVVGIAAHLSLTKNEAQANKASPVTPTISTIKKITPTPLPTNTDFDKTKYSLTDPTSLWVVANKLRTLNPTTYMPTDLVVPDIPLRSNITDTEKYVRSDMATALKTMVDAAIKQGITLKLQSGFRSYAFQVNLYNNYVSTDGQAAADAESARPGFSEHQTGWAADLGGVTNPSCNVEECFGNTPEGQWLAANAYQYGFIIRYPADKVAITGYEYEPWHVRYIGTDLSTEMHKQGIQTLEEFFGLPAAANYATATAN